MNLRTFKANASRHVLALLAIGTLLPVSALAQDAPVFTPASEWSVGATQLSNVRGLSGVKMPCVLSAEYDNGYVVRLSGGGGKLLAMAVDFRQDIFTKGRKYPVTLSVGTGYIKQASATAFTSSTLIVNLRPLGDVYQTLQKAQTLGLDIEENSMKFNLGNVGAQYKALEACYTGKNTPVVGPMTDTVRSAAVPAVEAAPVANAAPVPLLPADVAAKPMPKNFDDIVKGADQQKPPAQQQMKISQVTPRPPEQPRAPDPVAAERKISRADNAAPVAAAPVQPIPISPRVDSAPRPAPVTAMPAPAATPTMWEARAGEDMKIVLSRWAERAGYDLQWESDQDGKVAQDMSMSGSFEDAVSQLLAENSAASGIAGHVESAGARKNLAGVAQPVPAPVEQPVQAAIPAMNDKWAAPAGSSLQATLDQWAARAGVTVVWDDVVSLPVKKTVDVSGTFEQAVQSLLDQYGSDKTRPFGQLNTDPDNGQRTLTISLDKAG